jgi:aspartate-semialdehyde dehydrogenase
MGYKVAVIGATGNVGREMLQTLVDREFPVDEVIALASERSIGREVSFGEDKTLKVQDLAKFDFMDPDVPLVVPEVNAKAIAGYTKKHIIANPNCSTIQMVVALKPLHDLATIKRVVVATYQSVSGGGKEAMDELFEQTRGIYMNATPQRNKFTKQIAFNVIPHIDVFMEDGSTKEEWKMQVETRKILDPDIAVSATCVRVPVFIGHAEAVNIEFEKPITVEQARAALRKAPGVSLVDHREDEGYVTPVECAGEDAVYVSRVRKDPTVTNGLSLWVVSDNLRKGAALNAVQIAERLVQGYLTDARPSSERKRA